MSTSYYSAQNTAPVRVHVHASDPISMAGAMSQLRRLPEVEIVNAANSAPPAVVVVVAGTLDDPVLPQVRQFTRAGDVHVVLVVDALREAELAEVIESGVVAIVWRHEATEGRLLQAVLAASRGDGDMPPDLLGRLIQHIGLRQGAPPRAAFPRLAPREVAVLRLVAEGLNTSEIAKTVSYSERTVKSVLHGITTRLHLRNRAHAVAYALREGYI
ncbi:helix-turn-helix transcriptional regulator [Actinomadura roseirufa]|uniref:helix-turn-helix transcriptional regulator n=1 Tax=Actinomadura roseirufa TaxID=2094049 RepID=UPI001F5E9CF7|nr:response regulator transcription factor [Actinomadura roseirufa]